RVVVLLLRDVAINTLFGFLGADSMRHVGTERLAAESRRGDGLLLVIKPIALAILGADDNGTGGTGRRHSVSGYGPVDPEHVHVVAKDHEVVGGPIARHQAFIVQHGHALIGSHGQVTAKAAGRP